MKYQREGLLLPKPTEAAVDAHIYPSFDGAHLEANEVYDDLTVKGGRKAAAGEVLRSGKNFDMRVRHIDPEQLAQRLSALKAWKKELLARDDLDRDVRQGYRWKVNEDIANIHMLIASAAGDMKAFRRWNEYIYGKPDEDIYRAALDWVAHDAEELIGQGGWPASVVEAADRVLEQVGEDRGYRELLPPSPEVFKAVQDDHMREQGYYALLLAGVDIPQTGKIANDVGDPILAHIVRNNLESDYDIQDSGTASWGLRHSKRAVMRPAKYNMPAKRFIGLGAGHEIGSHLLEWMNGQRGPLALAKSGLDRTELGNEGRATIREQIIYPTFEEFGEIVRWRDILRRHIAASYMHGVGEQGPKTSHQAYEFMSVIDTMYQAKLTPDNPEETEEKAAKKTIEITLRAGRGTDGTGGAHLLAKVYLEGHVANWLTAATRGPRAVSEGDLGKFDISNPRHITLLQRLGLLPDND